MAYEFRLPDVGEGIAEAEIVRWLVHNGDRVRLDQPIVEIETDKAVVEVPAPVAGVIITLGGNEGDTLHVGDLLVVLDQTNGSSAAIPQQSSPAAPEPAQVAAQSGAVAQPQGTASATRPQATPAVRKLAREHGVDLAAVKGTGPGGRITAEDVNAFENNVTAAAGKPATPVADALAAESEASPVPPEKAAVGAGVSGTVERVPLRGLRRRIAEAMSESWRTIPHITGMDEVDVSGLVALRDRYRAAEGAEACI